MFSKLSAYGIQSQRHTWLTDFHYCHSQRVALNRILLSPLPVKAGVPQGCVLGLLLFLIFINDLSYSLENPLCLFADDSTLCRHIPHPSDEQVAASSLSSDLEKNITSWSNTWNTSFNPNKLHTLTVSERTIWQTLQSTFLTILLMKFSHSNSWVSLSAMIFLG